MQRTDFKRFAIELLPTCLRRPVMNGLLRSLMQGIVIAYMEFLSWKEERDYEIKHNGQVCHLRGMLNDAFDPIRRKITITDTEEKETDHVFIFKRETARVRRLRHRKAELPVIINVQGFGGAAGSNFTVNVPMEVAEEADMARLRAMVNTYKLAGKKWTMNYQRNIEGNENGNSKFFAAAKQGLSLGL